MAASIKKPNINKELKEAFKGFLTSKEIKQLQKAVGGKKVFQLLLNEAKGVESFKFILTDPEARKDFLNKIAAINATIYASLQNWFQQFPPEQFKLKADKAAGAAIISDEKIAKPEVFESVSNEELDIDALFPPSNDIIVLEGQIKQIQVQIIKIQDEVLQIANDYNKYLREKQDLEVLEEINPSAENADEQANTRAYDFANADDILYDEKGMPKQVTNIQQNDNTFVAAENRNEQLKSHPQQQKKQNAKTQENGSQQQNPLQNKHEQFQTLLLLKMEIMNKLLAKEFEKKNEVKSIYEQKKSTKHYLRPTPGSIKLNAQQDNWESKASKERTEIIQYKSKTIDEILHTVISNMNLQEGKEYKNQNIAPTPINVQYTFGNWN